MKDSNYIGDWQHGIAYPKELQPKIFQLTAVHFALARKRSYLALDPGLGKTICAILYINSLRRANPNHGVRVLYVCPPFLVENVKAEFTKWMHGTNPFAITFLPDSVLHKVNSLTQSHFTTDILIVDEAHRFKNEKSKRSKKLFGFIVPHYENILYLSGTPMPNRPIELWPVLYHSVPQIISHAPKFEYGYRYCALHRSRFGWDFSGASNVKELAQKVIGTFMLRLKKKDVLPELPPKTEELVFIDSKLPARLASLDRKLLKKYSPEDLMKSQIGEEHISSYRRGLGEAKINPAIKFIKNILDGGEESLLVFAIHKDVIAGLAKGLEKYNPLIMTGQVPTQKRMVIAKQFQHDHKRRLMLLNIQAGGVGFNLTKATRVIFVEYSWVPADNEQASDRAHRIGQKDNVFVQYLVYRNSIDKAVMETILRKKEITKHI